MTTIVVSNFKTGFETDRPPFEINNDAFPLMNNVYMWRGRLLKKRGVSQLGRLTRKLTASSLGNSPAAFTWSFTIYSTLATPITETNPQIVPGLSPYTLVITDGTDTFTDLGNGTLQRQDLNVTSTINYSTGAVTLNRTTNAANAFTITFSYYPDLPAMGIERYNINFNTPGSSVVPITVFFDTRYSYQYNQSNFTFYDVNFFVASGLPFKWSGADYQQFWTTNYYAAMWATNNKPGFNFLNIATITVGNPTTITTAPGNPLVTGDVIFINEVTGAGAGTLNLQTAVVTVTVPGTTFTIPIDTTALVINNSGIFQMLTNTVAGQDGIKYYIGDPTGPSLTKGWVNFAPPLSSAANPQYLVGAKIIIPFKNRLLFFATWTRSSSGAVVYNPNQLVACQNGTPYYANGALPPNNTADVKAFYQNEVGRGIRLNAPISEEVIIANVNSDIIIVQFEDTPLKLYSTGDDSYPFLYQTISSEFGASGTFSGVPLDVGVMSIDDLGITMTTQEGASRVDLQIPDQVFNISKKDNGVDRICSIRDYRNEFIYWTFPNNSNSTSNLYQQISWKFPTTTLAYNYREASWSTFTESYTTYGEFFRSQSYTWATLPFKTWAEWSNPWNYGQTSLGFPLVCCGNQQGFIMVREDSTDEAESQYISAIDFTTLQVTSPNHNLNDGDFIEITGCIGTGLTNLNNTIFKIKATHANVDTFILLLRNGQAVPTGTYNGNGTYSRLTNFIVTTRQFPVAWQNTKKTQLGLQRYLLERTQEGQITILLFVNQMDSLAANDPTYSAFLPFSNVLLTSPEPNDLNLTAGSQNQIWHRLTTPVIGDTIQVGFTLSEEQMYTSANSSDFILYAFALNVKPAGTLAM